jgi:hypothetical protein
LFDLYRIIDLQTEENAVIEAMGTSGRIIKEKVHVDKLKPYYPRDDTAHEAEIQVQGSEAIIDPLLEPLTISDVTDRNRHDSETNGADGTANSLRSLQRTI